MSAPDPADLLENVTDRASFLQFVQALIADRLDEEVKDGCLTTSDWGPGVNGWQNGSIVAFLDAAMRWAESTDMGERQGLPPGPTWKAFAVFLYCGKAYE